MESVCVGEEKLLGLREKMREFPGSIVGGGETKRSNFPSEVR